MISITSSHMSLETQLSRLDVCVRRGDMWYQQKGRHFYVRSSYKQENIGLFESSRSCSRLLIERQSSEFQLERLFVRSSRERRPSGVAAVHLAAFHLGSLCNFLAFFTTANSHGYFRRSRARSRLVRHPICIFACALSRLTFSRPQCFPKNTERARYVDIYR